MEKELRNALAKAVVEARFLLEDDFAEQLEGSFNIMPDGKVLGHAPGDPIVRSRLLEVLEHHRSTGMKASDAADRLRREMAFTTLNRFAALKLAEKRGIVKECVSTALESGGLKELADMAPGLRASADDRGYRLLLETVMDEISLGLKVLFDRRDPTALLWPRPPALDALLNVLNRSELESVWESDETIGWIYQYFNADDVDKMRKKSSAPRNSWELAVRNQFFTPRYVVEFLTDNTLGRTWYEMRRGETALKKQCQYLVYRPSEIFLPEGEEPPAEDESEELSQEEALKAPVHVRFRAKKDPRDLRILDPAVGSGHFLLYTFELLITIYEEAWEDEGVCPSELTGSRLKDDYPDVDVLRADLPELILRHNLHGIEIDPRCAQIASLALWLRAQRAWRELGLEPANRPAVTRTNIVVAEPIPADDALIDEFAASLDPPVLGTLFRDIVEEMRLAGELGSLLKVESAIERMVAKARKVSGEGTLFDGLDEGAEFWPHAEERLLDTLRAFGGQLEQQGQVRRRLFAGDAEHGVALIDVLRKKYDVVLMNPPFGACSAKGKSTFQRLYPRTKRDIYAAFVERGLQLLHKHGLLGAITSRTGFFLSSFQTWREEIILGEARPTVFADLGHGVMDSAMVEAAAYCMEAEE